MDKETQAQMDRLEQEIWNEEKDLADILADDVLKDLDELLEEAAAQSDSQQPREEPVAPEAKTEEAMVICRLVVGKYPKYRDVIPQNNTNILRIGRTQLLNTVRRVSVCSNKASNHIKFDLKSGSLMVSAQDLGFSIAAHETLQCQYEGDDLTIGFKSPFIIEILSNMGCGEIVMKFLDSKRAALIVPAEDEAESEKICGIIMPIMIS